jgi:hypothetical protein
MKINPAPFLISALFIIGFYLLLGSIAAGIVAITCGILILWASGVNNA